MPEAACRAGARGIDLAVLPQLSARIELHALLRAQCRNRLEEYLSSVKEMRERTEAALCGIGARVQHASRPEALQDLPRPFTVAIPIRPGAFSGQR